MKPLHDADRNFGRQHRGRGTGIAGRLMQLRFQETIISNLETPAFDENQRSVAGKTRSCATAIVEKGQMNCDPAAISARLDCP